ncbi:MAG: glycosyltransferase family 9 protein [Bacteriovoracaceae bacterium]
MKKNILVFKYRALGDAVLGLSSVSYLKKQFPEAKITYGVPHWVAPLFTNIQTDADEILALDFSNAAKWCDSYKFFKNSSFDQIIELNQSGRTTKFFNILKVLKPSVNYLAHNHHKNTGTIHDQGIKKANTQRDLDACWTAFKNGPIPHFLDYPPQMKLNSPVEKTKSIVLGVVATRDTKMWPLTHFKKLMQMLIKKMGEDIKFLIPLSQNEQDELIKLELKKLNLPDQAQFIHLPLNELPICMGQAKYYIGNDTGLKHICAALGLKTLTVFGIEDPVEWHPYGEGQTYLKADVPADAYKSPDEFRDCISKITPENVFNEFLALKAQAEKEHNKWPTQPAALMAQE